MTTRTPATLSREELITTIRECEDSAQQAQQAFDQLRPTDPARAITQRRIATYRSLAEIARQKLRVVDRST